MEVADHHAVQVLQRICDLETRADLAKRLRMGLLAKQRITALEIATCAGFSRRKAQK